MKLNYYRSVLIVIVFSWLFSSCGVVIRTMNPEYVLHVDYELKRDVIIFAPVNSKVFFAYNDADYELHGFVGEERKYTLPVEKDQGESTTRSTWDINTTADTDRAVWDTSYKLRKSNYQDNIKIKIDNNDETIFENVYVKFWGFDEDGKCLEKDKSWSDQSIVRDYSGNTEYLNNTRTHVRTIEKVTYVPITINLLE